MAAVASPSRPASGDPSPARASVLAVDDPRWAAFAAADPDATPFHRPPWAGVLAETYGLRAFTLAVADANGQVVAGAPFVELRVPGRRRRWVSLPFTDACAPLANGAAARERLVAALAGAGDYLGAPAIEIRADVAQAGWRRAADAVGHVLELEDDVDRQQARFSRSQVARNIRRAEREGVRVRAAATAPDLDAFWALHVRTRRRQGVPVQPRRFFDLLWRDLIGAGLGSILLASRDGVVLAGALFLTSNATTIYKFGASDPEGWRLRPNHLIFATAIRDAVERGDRRFDFGRTDLGNAGLRAFKRGWGAAEHPLVTSLLPPAAARAHDGRAARALGVAIRRGPAWVCTATGRLLYRYAGSR